MLSNWTGMGYTLTRTPNNLHPLRVPSNRCMPIRVLLVDDHAVVRQGLRMFLALDPELEVVAEPSNGTGIERVCRLNPATVLMDLIMPIMNGISLNWSGTG